MNSLLPLNTLAASVGRRHQHRRQQVKGIKIVGETSGRNSELNKK
jgi:hypothetical protein